MLTQFTNSWQVGLLIGRLGVGNRDFVLLLIPCPPVEVSNVLSQGSFTEALTKNIPLEQYTMHREGPRQY